jgi:hypothetical protein
MFLLCVSLVSAVEARATVLPDACGKDEIKFNVTTQKGQPVPAAPDSGKAQIVLIETLERIGNVQFFGGKIARFGVDGAWVGADRGDSYFVVAVDPGVHHLCANWQTIGPDKKNVGVASFTADPGKTYYYQVKITQKGYVEAPATGLGVTSGGGGVSTEESFDLTALSEDEGRYRVKSSALSTSTPKK